MMARTTPRCGKSVRVLTMMFIPYTDESAVIGRVTAEMTGGDPLFEAPHLTGQLLDERFHVPGQGGDNRVREIEGRLRVQLAGVDAGPHGAGLAERDAGVHRRVERPVHGHQVPRPDE